MLRRKNRLSRAGRTEKADALAKQIRTAITRKESAWLRKVNTRQNPKTAWAKVRQITKRDAIDSFIVIDGLTSQTLNDHYAAISTDSQYRQPPQKVTVADDNCQVTEFEVFRLFDRLQLTATGLDDIPAWFLRLGATLFAAPLAVLFSQSIRSGLVPRQWKTAVIKPIPKVANPTKRVDFRPISVTPVLSGTLERIVVKTYIYPVMLQSPSRLYFHDHMHLGRPGLPQAR